MLPRSDGDVYVCSRRKATHGAGACDVPPLKRAAVEEPMLEMFKDLRHDVAATRRRLAQAVDGRLEEIRSQIARADREAATKHAQAQRVERDYLAGDLSAATYERLNGELQGELAGAEAEVGRLREHARDVERVGTRLDVDDEAVRRLAQLQHEISEHIARASDTSEAAADVGALRAAIGALFERVDLERTANAFDAGVLRVGHPERYGELYLLPQLRADVVRDRCEWDDLNSSTFENLHRVPLSLPAENQTTSGVPE
jgi:hypothetical protein